MRLRRHLHAFAILAGCAQAGSAAGGDQDSLTFHADAGRSGWRSHEVELTRADVSGPGFGLIWESPPLDGDGGQPPRLYASPLYVDAVRMTAGPHEGVVFPVVIAATNHGFVYAISAAPTGGVPPGTILWRAALGAACRLQPVPLDGVPTGVLSTPVIDLPRQRLYVTSCDQRRRWQLHALELGSGASLRGWPLALDEAAFNAPGVNRNAGAGAPDLARRSGYIVQRGALNLSPDGARLYVTFGESASGWVVSVDTDRAAISSAFASVAVPHRNSGGIWGAGGAAVDEDGAVYVATGTAFNGYRDQPRDWNQSVLRLSDAGDQGLVLRGTYTPFNHCTTAKMDIDLGSGGVSLLPGSDSGGRLLAVGGKQGNVYLLDRDRLPGDLERRPRCDGSPADDGSLLAPDPQPQFAGRGPLNVFGPYSEQDAAMDQARGRSVPAFFRDDLGQGFLFVTGSTKEREGSAVNVPPSLVRLRVVLRDGGPAHLAVDVRATSTVFENPGSPLVTSDGTREAIVWVLDENARRSATLAGPDAPRPILYAFDAATLELLWKSRPGELHTSGKYNQPAIARGTVFVGTDRIQAFGRAARPPDGRQVYYRRCSACHENPGGRVPPREMIAMRSKADIIAALATGVMREMAAGLSDAEMEAVAEYLQ